MRDIEREVMGADWCRRRDEYVRASDAVAPIAEAIQELAKQHRRRLMAVRLGVLAWDAVQEHDRALAVLVGHVPSPVTGCATPWGVVSLVRADNIGHDAVEAA